MPGQPTLSSEDRRFVAGLPGVRGLHPRLTRVDTVRPDVAQARPNVVATIHATSVAWISLAGYRLTDGRLWSHGEMVAAAPVALIGGAWASPPAFVTIRGQVYTVIGALEGPTDVSGPDYAVWIPLAGTSMPDVTSYLIEIDAQEGRDERVAADLDRWMRMRYGTTPAGQSPVSISTFGAARTEMTLVRRALYAALIAFFAIPSIFVGGGVAAVTRLAIQQRVPEIGLRRAVGATRQQVLDLFVGEALELAWGATWRGSILGALGIAIERALGIAIAPPVAMMVLALALPSIVCFAFSVPAAVAAADLAPAAALGAR